MISDKNLFIVRTPLQLLNAMEARNRFHNNEKNILICIFRKKIDQSLMQKMIDDRWEIITFFRLTFFSRMFYPFLVYSFTKKMNKVKTIYIGLFGNVISHIVNSVRYEKIIIFDDGNEIFKIAQAIEKKTVKKSKIIHKLFFKKTDNNFIYNAKFFSIYDITKFISPEKLIRNDYRVFKTHIEMFENKDNVVYFIGSNLVSNYLEREKFQYWMRKVKKYFSDKSIIYILHRYENADIVNELGIKTIRFDNIIEYQFLMDKIQPAEIISFRSTALDTLKILYSVDVAVAKIPLVEFQENKQSEMKELYIYYDDNNTKIISLGSV